MIKSTDMKYASLYRQPRRELKSYNDWGDEASYGICLKRIGNNFYNDKMDDFGIFLSNKIVGVQHLLSYEFLYFEIFDSIDELKQHWECD